MAWDDEEEWPDLAKDPEALERRRQAMRQMSDMRRRALRWAYAGLGLLIVLVIYLASR